jgi:hypothetical protein
MFDISSCITFCLPVWYPKQLKIRIYRIITLLVVLYGCETWSLILREESRLRVLRGTFGRKREQGSGENYTMRNFMICTVLQILFG